MRKGQGLTMEEERKARIIGLYLTGLMGREEARDALSVSERHLWRLIKRFREGGKESMIHRNHILPSPKRMDPQTVDAILQLHKNKYYDFNDHFFTQKLNEEEGIRVGREKIRLLLRSSGIKPKQAHKKPKYRRRRLPMTSEGFMLQIDGSEHAWFGNRGVSCTLVSAIDDATKRIIYARFEPQETTASYLLMFRTLAEQGIAPLLVYADRHSIFYLDREPTVEEQLKDIIPRTQVGRALDELHIQYIAALKPQAKGRVERSFRTMQDRFVCELRLANVSTITQANLLLPKLINDYNKNFSISPSEALPSWFVLPSDFDPDSVFCFKETRLVKNDNTVSFHGKVLQIPENKTSRSFAKALVEVRHLLQGNVQIIHQNILVAEFKDIDINLHHRSYHSNLTPSIPNHELFAKLNL
jgi:transposase